VPHYYFHLFDDLDVLDEEGLDLADDIAARVHAVEEARTMACEAVQKGYLNLGHRIEIEDESGGRTPVTFRSAFIVEG
jgi:uncharacterized protein YggE